MTALRERLASVGFEPPENVCKTCKHPGAHHDLGNWCLVCPRPYVPKPEGRNYRFSDFDRAGWDYFASMTEDELWEYGIAALGPDAATLEAALAPGADDRLRRWARFIVDHTSRNWGGDWACVECHPESDLLSDGWMCAWHEAGRLLAIPEAQA